MLLNLIKRLLRKGIVVGYSTGKPFDPTTQVRTDGMKEITEKALKRKEGKHGS